jgi:hypothetical protein
LRMENNPVFRVVIVRPDQLGGWTPILVVCQRFAHPDTPIDAAQLAVKLLAKTVLPRTVARTTGNPASAARRRNFRRSSSLTSAGGEVASGRS